MAKASFTVDQGKRVGTSVRWFEAQGRPSAPSRRKYEVPDNGTSSGSTGQTMNVMTGLSVVGSNGTLNFQNVTVLAANATSSSNITFPGSSTSSRPFTGLLYAKTRPYDGTDGDTLILTAGAEQTFLSALNPIPAVDNGSGGTYTPWVIGNVFRVRAGGSGFIAGTDGKLSFFLRIQGAGPTNELIAGSDILAIPDTNGSGFRWSLDGEITVADGGTNGTQAVFSSLAVTLSGPSLTITGLAVGLPFSYCTANDVGTGGFPRGIVNITAPAGSMSLGAASYIEDATLTLTSMTFELLGPALQTTP